MRHEESPRAEYNGVSEAKKQRVKSDHGPHFETGRSLSVLCARQGLVVEVPLPKKTLDMSTEINRSTNSEEFPD